MNTRFISGWIIFIAIFAFTTLSHSEIYKYTDAQGNILFTDDLSRIPAAQRFELEAYPEFKTSPGHIKKKAISPRPVYCQLSYRDMRLAEILITGGVIPEGNDCPSEDELRYYENVLQHEYGIEDIHSWKPDPRLSTPLNTWQQHVDAMISGDIDRAAACFTPNVAQRKKSMYDAIGKEKLRQVALEMNPIQKISIEDNLAKYRIRRTEIHGGRSHDITYYVTFSNILGEWRIINY